MNAYEDGTAPGTRQETTIERMRRIFLQTCVLKATTNHDVIEAFRAVDRAIFVPDELLHEAYADTALPITPDNRATISQPYVVVAMIEAAELKPGDRVLDVGAGSGYSSAVERSHGASVIAIEKNPELVIRARENLARAGFEDVQVIEGDGLAGWEEGAPYDAIMVSGGLQEIPQTFLDQLAEGGRLIAPIVNQNIKNTAFNLDLLKLTRVGDRFSASPIMIGVGFVHLESSLPGGFERHDATESVVKPTREQHLAQFDNTFSSMGIRIASSVDWYRDQYPDLESPGAPGELYDRAGLIISTELAAGKEDAKETAQLAAAANTTSEQETTII